VAGAELAAVGFMLTINPPHVVQTASAITPIANNRILRSMPAEFLTDDEAAWSGVGS
jgi:hypothetical protein